MWDSSGRFDPTGGESKSRAITSQSRLGIVLVIDPAQGGLSGRFWLLARRRGIYRGTVGAPGHHTVLQSPGIAEQAHQDQPEHDQQQRHQQPQQRTATGIRALWLLRLLLISCVHQGSFWPRSGVRLVAAARKVIIAHRVQRRILLV
jgi:hypothetical protein